MISGGRSSQVDTTAVSIKRGGAGGCMDEGYHTLSLPCTADNFSKQNGSS
jgi:hypothetical protein